MNGLLITIIVLVAVYFLFIRKKKPTEHKADTGSITNQRLMQTVNDLGSHTYGQYWEGFKKRKPMDAKAIEDIVNRDMESLSDKDAFQIVTSLQRWSNNTGKPICELKVSFYKDIEAQGIPLNFFIDRLKQEKLKEAKQFNISPDNTICNFMYEIILEQQEKAKKEEFAKNVAKKLNIPDDEIESFERSVAEKEKELNIAPDISKLDREENRLFNLANEGIEMLDDLLCTSNDSQRKSLSEQGRIEARILCSTLVMDLHSNFKNEIDLDNQQDRYFLLLADQTMSDGGPDDVINFINSRISFYNEEISKFKMMSPLEVFSIDNPIGHIFNALYVKPLSEDPSIIDKDSISISDLVMFKKMLDDTFASMTKGKDKILGNTPQIEQDIYNEALNTFSVIIPPEKRGIVTKDMALIFTDQVITMTQSDENDKSFDQMPPIVVDTIKHLKNVCSSSNMTDESIKEILEEAQRKFILQFTN